MGNSAPSISKCTKGFSQPIKTYILEKLTKSELQSLTMIFYDMGNNILHSGYCAMPTFIHYTRLPGIICLRLFKYFAMEEREFIDRDEFLYGIAKLSRGSEEEQMEALFEIFDSDNDQYFTISDFITVLRTFEKFQIVPRMRKIAFTKQLQVHNSKGEIIQRSKTINEDEIDEGYLNSDSDVTIGSDEEDVEEYFGLPAPLSSKRIKKIAIQIFKEIGFREDSQLGIEEFTKLIKYCPYLKDVVIGAMRSDLWSDKKVSRSDNLPPINMIYRSIETYKDQLKASHAMVKINSGKNIADPNSTEITKSGYLFLAKNKFGCRPKFYCEMKGSILSFYSKKGSETPVKIFQISDKLFTLAKVNDVKCIKVYWIGSHKENARYYCENEEEVMDWFTHLCEASKNINLEDKYTLNETIGTGTFSTVRKGSVKESPEISVAVKIISKTHMTHNEMIFIGHELTTLNMINHPNVPSVYEFCVEPEKLMIVMQNIKHGELFGYLKEKGKLDFEEATLVISQILCLVKYLNELKIMHRDLKTENIMIERNSKGKIAKIYMIDFGLAKYIDSREEVTLKCGTAGYVAPEILMRQPYNEACDIWSIGIIYYLLLTGSLPFYAKMPDAILEKTVNDPVEYPEEILSLDPKVKEFIEGALAKDPSERLKLDDALSLICSIKT